MSAADGRRLDETLAGAKLAIRSEQIEVIAASDSNAPGNQRVHERTNERILHLLREKRLGRCIHVTGNARALVDPVHREVIDIMRRENHDSFSVLYRLPDDRRGDPVSAVAYNLERWTVNGEIAWQDKYLALGSIGKRSVDLLAYRHYDDLQFSVFGSEYVQLQAPHDDNADTKPVWLLRSARLNEALVERAEDLLRTADDIEEGWFADFRMLLNGVMASYMLRSVRTRTGTDRDGLLGDPRLAILPDDPDEVLRALEAMALLREDDGTLAITRAGIDFLEAV